MSLSCHVVFHCRWSPFICRIKSSLSLTLSFRLCSSSCIFCLFIAVSALRASCLERFAASVAPLQRRNVQGIVSCVIGAGGINYEQLELWWGRVMIVIRTLPAWVFTRTNELNGSSNAFVAARVFASDAQCMCQRKCN